MEKQYTAHYSVLKKECIEALTENGKELKKRIFADLTFGGGGHTFALAKSSDNSFVISTDQDPEALANGYKRIADEGMQEKIKLLDTNFVHFPKIVKEKFPEIFVDGGLSGVLMDLGVSSHHFDAGERGFSFRFDAPLDMRMDCDNDNIKTAKDLVNDLPGEELEAIISEYGEERFAKQIVRNILIERENKVIETTKDLENIIYHSYPSKMRHSGINPCTKTFQALRIAVNRELSVLEKTVPELFDLLIPGGKIAIISFHSLEDRIVKREFKKIADNHPFQCRILTKKPIVPSEEELAENSRSRSAKLRILEKIDESMLNEMELKKLKYQGFRNGD